MRDELSAQGGSGAAELTEHGLLQRWIRFNGVGALGVGVQLAVLYWLVRILATHYLWATAIAVESAVVHNFFWHERWTWRDRRSPSPRLLLARLGRFHVLNGAISFCGNLLLMRVLAGSMHIDPLAANIFAIIACSLANFGASELVVFRRVATIALALLLVQPLGAAAPGTLPAAPAADMLAVDLQPNTLQAWTAYEQRVDRRYGSASTASMPFFALDAFGAPGWRATARQGAVAMSRIDRSGPSESEIAVPDGKIHHWAGAIFVPTTSVPAVLDRLSQLAGGESKHYEEVIASRLLSKDGDRYRVFMKLNRSKFSVDVTYNTEHLVEYRRLGTARASARSVATKIAQLQNAGEPGEREMKPGSDSGYLWRLNAYWRYEAIDNGVLIECESVSLSRGVPMLLRPFITGVVEGLARDSLQRTLVGLRTTLTNGGRG